MATTAEFRELLDERLAAHDALSDARSQARLDAVKAEIIATIATHNTSLQLHDRRIGDLEKKSEGWRSWALGVVGALIVAAVQLLVHR